MIVNQLDIMLLMRNMLFVIKNLTGVEPNSYNLYLITKCSHVSNLNNFLIQLIWKCFQKAVCVNLNIKLMMLKHSEL